MDAAEKQPPHHVLIVGAGFGGLNAAKALRRAPVRVTLVDRRNHHTFQPLLYQVATAGLNATEVAYPIRRVLRKQENALVLMADVKRVDLDAKKVFCANGELSYDTLVLAVGATHSYFGHDDWAPLAPGLKSIDDALEMRRRVLLAYEAAEREEDPAARRVWTTFVVVGGGPTGVELAGALAEIARHTLAGDFRRIDPTETRVVLLEGAPRVLPTYVPELSEEARRELQQLGVEVRTGARVTGIDAGGVWVGPERIAARTVLWGAGVAASPLARSLGVPLDRVGRVKVEPDLTVPGHPEVYVIGDLAAVSQEGGLVPGVAPAAIQEGRHAALNIERTLLGLPRLPFHYRDKGSIATIGRARAIADFGRIKLSGPVAWLAWLVVHILFLVGFRNRFAVLLDWAWSYLTYERGARVITGEPPPLPRVAARPALPAPASRLPLAARAERAPRLGLTPRRRAEPPPR